MTFHYLSAYIPRTQNMASFQILSSDTKSNLNYSPKIRKLYHTILVFSTQPPDKIYGISRKSQISKTKITLHQDTYAFYDIYIGMSW